jgi:hypothetical protein
MLDPICIKKAKAGENSIPKTIIRFCKGDPILITGDVGGNIDVYRIHSKYVTNFRRLIAKGDNRPKSPPYPFTLPQRVHDGCKRIKEAKIIVIAVRAELTSPHQFKAGRPPGMKDTIFDDKR